MWAHTWWCGTSDLVLTDAWTWLDHLQYGFPFQLCRRGTWVITGTVNNISASEMQGRLAITKNVNDIDASGIVIGTGRLLSPSFWECFNLPNWSLVQLSNWSRDGNDNSISGIPLWRWGISSSRGSKDKFGVLEEEIHGTKLGLETQIGFGNPIIGKASDLT